MLHCNFARRVSGRLALVLIVALALPHAHAAEIPVVVSPQAAPVERAAAEELAAYLGRIYLEDRFAVGEQVPPSGRAILVGDAASNRRPRDLLPPESYTVTASQDGRLLIVAGGDARGVVYGVYALLEKLGCGFYLSYDAIAPARREKFAFDGWKLADRPLVADRLVFNWHNFLSGCSTWNLADWKAWTLQSKKQGYNAIMVHAYGNNPMVSFTLNGKTKPVGYLSTTVKGRDWSTMHVNDVRRLWGGEVFSSPAFGCEAAMVPDQQRAAAAQKLMRQVFAYAEQRAMNVFFADDVDTISANPQELILTLPREARFATGDKARPVWLANPDTPQGYRYYRAQVESLLTAYPQITCLVAWFRNGATPWMNLKLSEMPAEWQEEYRAEIAKTPEAARFWASHSMFAIGKIVRAMDRALEETGWQKVQLAAGTWNFDFLPGADRFLPSHVKLIGLDYAVLRDQSQLGAGERRALLAAVGGHRPIVPVIWAHHDDGNYIGRPYTPFEAFHSKLADAKATGFGIIHWTTRPLDLFFVSHAKQVWRGTQDQPLRATCDDMAKKSFGAAAQHAMAEYLERWITDAPKFARETGERFIDRPLTDIPEVVAGCRRRMKLIDSVERDRLSPQQRDRLEYYRGLEQAIIDIHQTQGVFQEAEGLWKSGKIDAAREAMAGCHPEAGIEQFARSSASGGITRGEQGLVVTMNTRWLPHYVRFRQALGMESVRYRFGPTSHDPLAQSPGRFTFFFDSQRRLWQVLGSEETRAETFVAPAAPDELCRSGIESEKPLALALQPILHPATLQPGRYTLCLWMLDPTSTAAGQRVFDVSVRAAAGPASIPDRIDIFKETGRTGRVLVRSYPIQVTRGGEVQVRLTPVAGKVVVCAAALEPADAEHGASVSRQKRILEQMRKVNAYQLTHPCMEEDDRNWQRGTWYTGVMAAYKASRDQRFLEQARQWGNRHRWQVGGRDSPANKLTCVQTWLELYAIDMDPAMYEPAVKWLNSGSPLTPSGAKVWYMEGGRRYADSLYVGPPALAMLARVTGDAKYLRWMHAFFWDVHAELFDKEAGLFYRDKRFIGQTTPNGKKILWSRGNGWVMGGIVRILEYLPADDPQRARYVELLKAMAAAVARTQGADGLWRSNLDDPKQFPDPESSGSGFFCYAFAWGINHGVLDPVVYAPGAHKAWAGLTNCVSPEGKLMWGQRVGDRPAAATQDQTYEFVTGTFLLAGSEILKLKP